MNLRTMTVSDLLRRLPRPTRATFVIAAVGVLAVGGATVFYTSRSSDRDAATSELSRLQTAVTARAADLERYRQGDVLDGAELAARVGPAETLLPDRHASPVPVFSDIEDSARRFGLTPSGLSTTLAYTAVSGADAASYPGLWSATGSLRVAGPVNAIRDWLASLEAYPQMLTYTTAGLTTTGTAPSLDVTVKLWAVDDPEWRTGRPAPAGSGTARSGNDAGATTPTSTTSTPDSSTPTTTPDSPTPATTSAPPASTSTTRAR